MPHFWDADAMSNPFDLKCSTLYAGLKQSCTSAAPSSASPTTIELAVQKQVSGVVDSDAHIADAILDARPVVGEVLPNLIKHLLIVEF
jgi:hypothetical protein